MRPDFFHRNLYDLAALGSLFSGLTLAILVGFTKRPSQTANLFLSLALGVIVLKTGGLSAALLPALGPLLFFYTRQLTRPQQRFQPTDWLHFCPLLVGYWIPLWLSLLLVISYVYFAHRLIQEFYSRLRPVLMDRPRLAFRWLDNALLLLGCSCLVTLVSDPFVLTIAFVLMGLAGEVILQADHLVKLTMPITDRSDAKEKGRRLKQAVLVNHLYEDAELTLTTLAGKLAIHPHELSRIINVGLNKNFSDFINECRVRAIARKMRDPAYDRLTLVGIAYESGFNSQRTFNRVFKEITGKTPIDYKNSLKKEWPIDKLATSSRIRPVVLRSESLANWAPGPLNPSAMFTNYLKIACRNLIHNKVYSGVNISGLAIGMACCLAIALYVWDEYSFDRFHKNAKHIYRVVEKQNQAGTLYDIASSPGMLAPALKADFAQIQQTCRMARSGGVLTHGSTTVEENTLSVDHSFFSMFDFPLLRGNAQTALLDPNEIILSERMAERFFGSHWHQSTQLLGQVIKLNGRPLTVAGVAKNAPYNSHIQFDILLSFRSIEVNPEEYKWTNNSHYNYILLNPKADVAALNQKLFHYLARYRPIDKPTLWLQPLLDIYLNPDFDFQTDWPTKGSRLYIRIFIAVGLIVLLIALFNFMNLATARARKRAQEVGVRKAIGAFRLQLIVQFLGESLLMTLLANVLALVMLQLCLPFLNKIAAKSLIIPFTEPSFGYLILGFVVLVSGLAGMYPAFYLSRFQPVKVLKGTFDVRSGQLFRRTLVVSQFVMSVMLIIGALVIYKQLRFIQDRNLGFDKSQLLQVGLRNELSSKTGLLKSELQQQTSIAKVTVALGNLVDLGTSTDDLGWEGQAPGESFLITHMNVDPDFLATTGMQLIAGRNFDSTITTDTSSAYMINETAAKRMHWTPEQALGKTFTFWGKKGEIIGVVKDFHFRPLTASIEPFLFRYWPTSFYGTLLVKTQPNQTREAIAAVEALYKKYKSLMPPNYAFVDESLEVV